MASSDPYQKVNLTNSFSVDGYVDQTDINLVNEVLPTILGKTNKSDLKL